MQPRLLSAETHSILISFKQVQVTKQLLIKIETFEAATTLLINLCMMSLLNCVIRDKNLLSPKRNVPLRMKNAPVPGTMNHPLNEISLS